VVKSIGGYLLMDQLVGVIHDELEDISKSQIQRAKKKDEPDKKKRGPSIFFEEGKIDF
jgi:hypothetical protein